MKRLLAFYTILLICSTTSAQAETTDSYSVDYIEVIKTENKKLKEEVSKIKQDLAHAADKYNFISQQYIDYKDQISRDNNHTLWILGLIVTLMGVGFPLYTNWRNDQSTKEKIKDLERKISAIGEIEKRIKTIESTIQEDRNKAENAAKDAEISMLFSEGNKAYYSKEYTRAFGLYNKILMLSPNNLEALTNIGNVKSDMGKPIEAIIDFNKVIEIDPSRAEVYYNRGRAYCNINKYEEAIANFSKAIELNPNISEAYQNRGYVVSLDKRYKEAILDYDIALSIDSRNINAYINRGNALSYLNKYEDAITDYDSVIKLDPNNTMAYNNRSIANLELKRYQAALSDINKALALEPADIKYLENRAECFKRMRLYNDALSDYDTVANIDGDKSYIYEGRASIYSAMANDERLDDKKTEYITLAEASAKRAKELTIFENNNS